MLGVPPRACRDRAIPFAFSRPQAAQLPGREQFLGLRKQPVAGLLKFEQSLSARARKWCSRCYARMQPINNPAGLESAPISVITMPGTKNPKYQSDLAAKYHRPRDER